MQLSKKIVANIWFKGFSDFERQETPEKDFLVVGRQILQPGSDRMSEVGFASVAGNTGFIRIGSPKFELRFESTSKIYFELFPSQSTGTWYGGGLLTAYLARFSKSNGSLWHATTEQQMDVVVSESRCLYEESVRPTFLLLSSLDAVCEFFESDLERALTFGSELMYAIAFLGARRFSRAHDIAAHCLAKNKRDSTHVTGTINLSLRDAYQRACVEIMKRSEPNQQSLQSSS